MHHPAWYLAVFVLSLPAVISMSIESYEVVFDMEDDVRVTVDIRMSEAVSDQLAFGLPLDYRELSVTLDGQSAPFKAEDNLVLITLVGNREISLSYTSSFYIDNRDFLYDFNPAIGIEDLTFRLLLPEDAELEEGLSNGGSIYPRPTRAVTDGKRIGFVWERKGVMAGDELALYVKLEDNNFMFAAGWELAITVLVSGVVYLIVRRRPSAHIDKHLKEDEQVVITVLKQREGQKIEQGTLRVVTGFSKASLSRLLSELEERNIVYKEKRGRKNLVWLKS
jgi:hypothetical protein